MNVRKRKADSLLVAMLLLVAIVVTALVLTYSWVMSMVGSQSAQAQTQIRLDSVDWGVTPHTTITIVIRNTGSVGAMIESVAMRENKAGAGFVTITPDAANPKSVDVSSALPFKYTLAAPTLSTAYVLRVTATTGFYYELVATTPSS
jgi:FlaG/FlaF family flagellin (archaellin)